MTEIQGEERLKVVAWALSYPFERPLGSYVFDGTDDIPLTAYLSGHKISYSELISGREPVLAVGSNASPSQLRRKFDSYGLSGEIPVIKAVLSGFDSVYSAHIAGYGSIPATLVSSPGTEVELFVTFLNEGQLYAMDISEGAARENGNYERIRLGGVRLVLDSGEVLDEAFSYQSRKGALVLDGQSVALVAIIATGRKFPAMTQMRIQEIVRDKFAPGERLDDFIWENIGENGKAKRDKWNSWLKEGI